LIILISLFHPGIKEVISEPLDDRPQELRFLFQKRPIVGMRHLRGVVDA